MSSAPCIDTYEADVTTLARELVRAVRAEREATADTRGARALLLSVWAPSSVALTVDGATVRYKSAYPRAGAVDVDVATERDRETVRATMAAGLLVLRVLGAERLPSDVRATVSAIGDALTAIAERHAEPLPRQPGTTVAATVEVRLAA